MEIFLERSRERKHRYKLLQLPRNGLASLGASLSTSLHQTGKQWATLYPILG